MTAVLIVGRSVTVKVVVFVLRRPQSEPFLTSSSPSISAYTAEGVMILSKKSLQSLKVTFLEGRPGSRPATALAHASRVQREREDARGTEVRDILFEKEVADLVAVRVDTPRGSLTARV